MAQWQVYFHFYFALSFDAFDAFARISCNCCYIFRFSESAKCFSIQSANLMPQCSYSTFNIDVSWQVCVWIKYRVIIKYKDHEEQIHLWKYPYQNFQIHLTRSNQIRIRFAVTSHNQISDRKKLDPLFTIALILAQLSDVRPPWVNLIRLSREWTLLRAEISINASSKWMARTAKIRFQFAFHQIATYIDD